MRSREFQAAPSTLPAALDRACHDRSGSPFLLGEAGTDWTYADMDRLSDQLAAGLLAAGIHSGDRIAIATPNCPE